MYSQTQSFDSDHYRHLNAKECVNTESNLLGMEIEEDFLINKNDLEFNEPKLEQQVKKDKQNYQKSNTS